MDLSCLMMVALMYLFIKLKFKLLDSVLWLTANQWNLFRQQIRQDVPRQQKLLAQVVHKFRVRHSVHNQIMMIITKP